MRWLGFVGVAFIGLSAFGAFARAKDAQRQQRSAFRNASFNYEQKLQREYTRWLTTGFTLSGLMFLALVLLRLT